MTNVLEVRKLSAGYGPLRVLHEIDLAVVAGERVGLVGLNGHGKTTFLARSWGVSTGAGARSSWTGSRSCGRRRTGSLGRGSYSCPQGDALFPGLSVRDNLDSGAFAAGWRERRKRRDRVLRLFPRLADRLRQSGGHALGRGAADVLARAGPHVGRPGLPDPRALARARPGHRCRPLLHAQGARSRRRDPHPRRAEPDPARGLDRQDRQDARGADRRHRAGRGRAAGRRADRRPSDRWTNA